MVESVAIPIAETRASEVSLTFRGFECSPAEVVEIIGIQPKLSGERGGSLQSGAKIKRSFVYYELKLPQGTRLDEMIPAILLHLGGVEPILRVRQQVELEFLEFDLLLPIKDSPRQDGGFLTQESISDLHTLEATISFGFVSGRQWPVA